MRSVATLLAVGIGAALSIHHGREADLTVDASSSATKGGQDDFHEDGPDSAEPLRVGLLETGAQRLQRGTLASLLLGARATADVLSLYDHVISGMIHAPGHVHDAVAAHPEPFAFCAAVVLGLLSSSCCLLQLLVNLLAVVGVCSAGCVGFRKVLEPWQPYTRAGTLLLVGCAWGTAAMPLHCLARQTVLCLVLMFMPEVVGWLAGRPVGTAAEGQVRRELLVGGVSCEACALTAQQVLERAGGVVEARVAYPSGEAQVLVAADARSKAFDLRQIEQDLTDHGFSLAEADATSLASAST